LFCFLSGSHLLPRLTGNLWSSLCLLSSRIICWCGPPIQLTFFFPALNPELFSLMWQAHFLPNMNICRFMSCLSVFQVKHHQTSSCGRRASCMPLKSLRNFKRCVFMGQDLVTIFTVSSKAFLRETGQWRIQMTTGTVWYYCLDSC
jgi:hypothetical protein